MCRQLFQFFHRHLSSVLLFFDNVLLHTNSSANQFYEPVHRFRTIESARPLLLLLLPDRPVGEADVLDFVLLYRHIESTRGLWERVTGMVAKILVHVFMVGLQSAQIGLYRVYNVSA